MANNHVSPQLLSVAPMMDWTDTYFRQMVRLISKHTWLYTEMVVDKTLIHNPQTDRFLWFPAEQHPIVCQLGGSVPEDLAKAAALVARYGYDEINLNCGCPSSRVAGKGCFGAALMTTPQLVADCCAAMAAAAPHIPITVKCRLGVDDVDSYEQLCTFIRTVSEGSPVRHFVIHCRKAILDLDPAENRSIPPLRRGWAFALKRDFPHLQFSVNGQVHSTPEALQTLSAEAQGARAHGVMIGRAVWKRPWEVLSDADRAIFGADTNGAGSRRQVLEQYAAFADTQLGRWYKRPDGTGVPTVRTLATPMFQLFFGERGGSKWKRALDSSLKGAASVSQLLAQVLPSMPDDVLDAPPKSIIPLLQPLELDLPPPPPSLLFRSCIDAAISLPQPAQPSAVASADAAASATILGSAAQPADVLQPRFAAVPAIVRTDASSAASAVVQEVAASAAANAAAAATTSPSVATEQPGGSEPYRQQPRQTLGGTELQTNVPEHACETSQQHAIAVGS